MKFLVVNLVVLLLSVCAPYKFVRAQTGGAYDISHSVVAEGGGQQSSGGYTISGTIGQPLAGTLSGSGNYSIRGGFWAFGQLVPTAAAVSLSGRVFSGKGSGIIRNARVFLFDTTTGIERDTQTNESGFYRFEELEIGRLYIVQATSQRYTFTPDNYIIELLDNRDEVNFTGQNNILK